MKHRHRKLPPLPPSTIIRSGLFYHPARRIKSIYDYLKRFGDISSNITPAQMRHGYGIDAVSFGEIVGDGTGQTIAIIDATGSPNAAADLQVFDAFFGIPDPPSFTILNENGGATLPDVDPSGPTWRDEQALDVQWAHAMAPAANIILYQASNPGSAMYTAIGTAINTPGVTVVSMSWGGPEFSYQSLYDAFYFTTPAGHIGAGGIAGGITFLASTGDTGDNTFGSLGIQYPAASPNVIAVGGTVLTLDDSGNYLSEAGWSGSGGGISAYQSQPTYQSGVVTQSTLWRTIPDVAINAGSTVPIYNSYDGGWADVGGTSLACPMWAGLIAMVNQGRALLSLGSLDGPTQTLNKIYSIPSSDFNDITTGNNGYAAGAGYDLVTGLGTPIADLAVPDLAGTPTPTPTPTPSPTMTIPTTASLLNPDLYLIGDAGTFQDVAELTPATANGDPVKYLADQSGNGYDFSNALTTNPTLATNSVNGKSAIQFDGVASFLSGGNPAGLSLASGGYTIITIGTPATNFGQWLSKGAFNNPATQRISFIDGGSNAQFGFGSGVAFIRANTFNGVYRTNVPSICYYTYNPSGSDVGTEQIGSVGVSMGDPYVTSGSVPAYDDSSDWTIGISGNSELPFQGPIYVMLIYKQVLSLEQIAQIGAVLGAYYAIPVRTTFADTSVRLLGVGDSTMEAPDHSLADPIAAAGEDLGSRYCVYNFGLSGSSAGGTNGWISKESTLALYYSSAYANNIIIFTSLINTLSPGGEAVTPATAYAQYQSFGTSMKGYGFKVVLTGCTPNDFSVSGYPAAANALLKADFGVATSSPHIWKPNPGITYADLYIDMAAVPELSDNTNSTYFEDGTHMTVAGYAVAGAQYAAATRLLVLTPICSIDALAGLYQDAGATEPVTANGQIVLLAQDQSGNGNNATQYGSDPGIIYNAANLTNLLTGDILPILEPSNSVLTLGNPDQLNNLNLNPAGYSVAFIAGAFAATLLSKNDLGSFLNFFYSADAFTITRFAGSGDVGMNSYPTPMIYTFTPTGENTATETWYVGGKVAHSRTGSVPDWDSDSPWAIGAVQINEAGTQYGSGYINLLRIYDHALDPDTEVVPLADFMADRISGPLSTDTSRLLQGGDSIGFGYNADALSSSFFALTAQATHVANRGIINLCTPGMQAADGVNNAATEYVPWALDAGKTIFILQHGTNDIAANVTAATVYASRKSIAATMTAAGCSVIMLSILPRSTALSNGQTADGFESTRQTLAAMEAADFPVSTGITRVASRAPGTTWAVLRADIGADPTFGPEAAGANEGLYADGTHPNQIVHTPIANNYTTPAVELLFSVSASIVIGSLSLDTTGTILTGTLSGGTGAYSPSTGLTGFTVHTATISSSSISGSTFTLILSVPIHSGVILTVDLSPDSNITDSISDTCTGQTGVPVINNSQVTSGGLPVIAVGVTTPISQPTATITITYPNPSATILYQLVGGGYDGLLRVYTAPLVLNRSATVIAFSSSNGVYGQAVSLPVSFGSAINPQLALDPYATTEPTALGQPDDAIAVSTFTPAILPASGQFLSQITVSLTVPAGGVTYYTTDGSDPNPGGAYTAYSQPFTLTASTLVKALSVDVNGLPSLVARRYYLRQSPKPARLAFDPYA